MMGEDGMFTVEISVDLLLEGLPVGHIKKFSAGVYVTYDEAFEAAEQMVSHVVETYRELDLGNHLKKSKFADLAVVSARIGRAVDLVEGLECYGWIDTNWITMQV